MEFGSFPQNLAYNVKSLSRVSKTVVKLITTPLVDPGVTFKVRLTSNCLVDLRTLPLLHQGTCTSSSGGGVVNPLFR